jgi:hypothetical protein
MKLLFAVLMHHYDYWKVLEDSDVSGTLRVNIRAHALCLWITLQKQQIFYELFSDCLRIMNAWQLDKWEFAVLGYTVTN